MSKTTPEEEARWNANWTRGWEAASEFERRRYRQLDAGDRMEALGLVMGGTPLGEAVREASGNFADFLRERS